MPGSRQALVSCLAFAFAVPQLADAFLRRNDWPFSAWGMYSYLQSTEDWGFELYAVLATGAEQRLDDDDLFPLDAHRLEPVFETLHSPDLDLALRDVLRRFNGRRQGLAPARALRLYEYRIKIGASGAFELVGHTLIKEVDAADAKPR